MRVCDEGVWVNHCTLTAQPHPVPYTLTHASGIPAISHPPHPLLARDRHSEAEPLFRQALEQWQQVLGPEHPDTITSIINLAECIHKLGRWAGSDAA